MTAGALASSVAAAERAETVAGKRRGEKAIELVGEAERCAHILDTDDPCCLFERARCRRRNCRPRRTARGDDGRRPAPRRRRAAMLTAPVEKLSMAGTRPEACSPKMVTKLPAALGSRTPTFFSPGVSAARLAAEDEASHDDAAIGQRRALDVLEDLVAGGRGCGARVEQRLEQGLVGEARPEHHVGHDVVEPVGRDNRAVPCP